MPKPDIHRMIRVDQAGEFGATRIYAGQLAVMGDRGPHSAEIAGMAEQEAQHRAKFDALMARRGVRHRPHLKDPWQRLLVVIPLLSERLLDCALLRRCGLNEPPEALDLRR